MTHWLQSTSLEGSIVSNVKHLIQHTGYMCTISAHVHVLSCTSMLQKTENIVNTVWHKATCTLTENDVNTETMLCLWPLIISISESPAFISAQIFVWSVILFRHIFYNHCSQEPSASHCNWKQILFNTNYRSFQTICMLFFWLFFLSISK